jgi:hypothetical protein
MMTDEQIEEAVKAALQYLEAAAHTIVAALGELIESAIAAFAEEARNLESAIASLAVEVRNLWHSAPPHRRAVSRRVLLWRQVRPRYGPA